ncbi:MAG: multicopper oxidase domain-containing protein, partial [bacterium]
MHHRKHFLIPLLMAFLLLMATVPSGAGILVQCPGDTDGDAIIDNVDPAHPNAKCMHLGAGDGYSVMADGKLQYIFSFADLTGIPTRTKKQKENLMHAGMLAANWPAPTIMLDEGDEFYLNLTNVGMMMRPDLFDPHTVHWHGFPNAASVFDGVPDASIAINMGATLTYYYKVAEPGT